MEVLRIEVLPPLVWLLDLGRPRALLVCGRDVEVFPNGFFEGCWAGDFVAQDFATARHSFGSGAVRSAESPSCWTVVTPSHTVDAVYLLERSGRPEVASNSLTFLTCWVELHLPFDRGIAARMISARDGVDRYERLLFKGEGWRIQRACFDNIEVTPDALRFVAKRPLAEMFTDFATYESYLLDVLAAVAANGAAPQRHQARYELASTCSSGYDSAACAVLAASLGARQAFTIKDARDGGDNSGRPMLERLGLRPVEIARPPRPAGEGFPEAEFIATGMGGDEFPFTAFGPHLRGIILLTGLGGERMWGCSGPVSRTAFQDDEPAGASLAEFRLRCGFVHLPVGWIGFESQPELRALSLSQAMRPWNTGSGYERPIARRIIEERGGVPRGRFATVKRAASATFHYASYWWSHAALEDLRRFERQHVRSTRQRLAYHADETPAHGLVHGVLRSQGGRQAGWPRQAGGRLARTAVPELL